MGRKEIVKKIVEIAKREDKGKYIGSVFFPGGEGEIFTKEKYINKVCKIRR